MDSKKLLAFVAGMWNEVLEDEEAIVFGDSLEDEMIRAAEECERVYEQYPGADPEDLKLILAAESCRQVGLYLLRKLIFIRPT